MLKSTRPISAIAADEYDAVWVAGGGGPLLTFKDDVALHELIATFYERGKIVALICHGSSLLLWTRLSNGKLLAEGKNGRASPTKRRKLYFESESVTVVTGGREEIADLLALPFDFIFFTGSSAVGKIVMRAAAENLTPVILELGGQNPTIVDETANLDIAADRIAWGHNAISGQWCIAPGYVMRA
jgi:putative intracellular protease/amidase